jgi:Na+-driven multidrug efflux pump
MSRLFSKDPEVLRLATRMLRILAAGYIAMGFTQVLGGLMRGAGDTMTPMWISILTSVALRVPLAYIMAAWMRDSANPADSLYISLLCTWVFGALLSSFAYKFGRWHKVAKKMLEDAQVAAKAEEDAPVGAEGV